MNSTSIRLLVVGDADLGTDLAGVQIPDGSFSVETVADWDGALAAMADESFDCLFLSATLPAEDRVESAETVRERHGDHPVIVHVGEGESALVKRAVDGGVADFVRGEFDLQDLAYRIKNACQEDRPEPAKFERFVDHAPAPMAVVREGTFRYANQATADLLNEEDPSAVVGRSVAEYTHEDSADLVQERLELLEAGERLERADGKVRTSDGEVKDVDVVATPIRWNGSDAGLVRYVDISERKRRKQELNRLTERFRAFVENGSDIVSVVDQRGVFQYNSPSMERILGYETGELEGESAFELIHPEDREAAMERFYRMLEEPETATETVEFRFPRADGSWAWLESVGSNQRHSAIDGLVVNSRDISERKERERELREYKRLFEAVLHNPETVVGIFSPDGVVERMNQTALEILAQDPEDVEGEYFWDTAFWEHSGERQQQLREDIRQAAEGEFVRFHATHPLPDGSEAHIDATLYPVLDDEGDVVKLVGVGRDVTELKERERELERKNERLEEFAAVVSHDLRNPLNVAQGRLELLAEEAGDEHVVPIERALERMDALIEDVLAIARADDRVTEADSLDLSAVARDCWRNVETGTASLRIEGDCEIRAERMRLSQLLENLMRNAVEHAGPDVTITVGTLPNGAGFFLEDDGPGIPESEREDVFERGYTTNRGGTGLGLPIVARVVESHGWEVRITESADGGARFELRGVETTA